MGSTPNIVNPKIIDNDKNNINTKNSTKCEDWCKNHEKYGFTYVRPLDHNNTNPQTTEIGSYLDIQKNPKTEEDIRNINKIHNEVGSQVGSNFCKSNRMEHAYDGSHYNYSDSNFESKFSAFSGKSSNLSERKLKLQKLLKSENETFSNSSENPNFISDLTENTRN